MRRRGVGLSAIKNKDLAKAKFKDKGTEISEDQLSQMSKQLEAFQGNLEEFAGKHKDEIKKSPAFRVQFQEMCASIGVDPLASCKGFWSEVLGVGDFYYELGVQVIETCLATSHRNGGLMDLDELRTRLVKSRGKKAQEISNDDLLRGIKKLKILGSGFTVVNLGTHYMVQSVPGELTMDHTQVLRCAEETSFVTLSNLKSALKWEEERAHNAVDYMVKEGLAWVDDQGTGERKYWFPSFFPDAAA